MRGFCKHIQYTYDQQPQREWERLERHRTEFAVTMRTLIEHLPPPPARVLDCGGGPGRYAIELARLGYDVTLFDLSSECLRFAKAQVGEAGVTLEAYEQGTATDLSRFPDEGFDAVLLLGPLYHLLEEPERIQALAEARRVLKPGGPLFAAFITRYAPIRYVSANEPAWILENPDLLETLLTSGNLPPRGEHELEFVAHFAHPTDAVSLCRGVKLEIVTVLGVEGVVSMIEHAVNVLSGAAWDNWVDLNYLLASDPSIHGCVEHLLVVTRKPLWRAVVARVAHELDKAGIHYTVVGGAAVALHGVPVPVKDVDVETDRVGAYRFQTLFPDNVAKPVALRESQDYRSHFGSMDFDGVTFEVMGDLHRREGEDWIPTAARTGTTVDVEGTPVRGSWLEEETLAYIRRGRLSRAAQCMPHCDHSRLLALLRQEASTAVL